MIARLVLGLVAVFAFALFMLSQPAAAAYPCPGGPGPGEVQVGVTGGSHGVAAIPVCDRAQGGGDSDGGGVYYIYGSIAWHPDADDVWMIGSYDAPYIAEREALAACNGAMGGGCSSIGEWHNSSMAIIRDRSGVLWNAWTGNGGAARKRTLAECSAKQHVPCEVLATFSSGKRRHAPDLATARKLYAVGAWVEGTEGFDSRLYIASGQRDPRVAERLALEACAKATARRCEILAFAGNGFIQTYRLGTSDQSATVETSAKRAAQAAKVNCKKRAQVCTLQRAYDSRTPGEFVHDFMGAAAK